MKPNIAVLTDSSSDLPQALIASHDNVAVVPAVVTFDNQEYLDRVTMTPAEFYQRLRVSDTLPKTASPAPAAIIQAIAQLIDRGYTQIVAFTVAGVLSATQQSFQLAAAQFPQAQIKVFDTKSVGIGSGLQAAYALKLIDEGVTWENLIQNLTSSIKNSHVYFYIPTLKYLRAGGRIGRVAGLVGSALKLKPVISCDTEGTYYPIAKSRSEHKALTKMIALATDSFADTDLIAVAYGDHLERAQQLASLVEQTTHRPVDFIGDISPALGVHVGPDLLGIGVLHH